MRSRRLTMAAAAAAIVLVAVVVWPRPDVVVVEPGKPLQAVLDEVAPGTVVVAAAGIHHGPVRVTARIELRGEPGAAIVSPASADSGIVVAASGTRLSGVRIEGASTGVLVREVTGVIIEDVEVSGAELHGIEVVDGSASIRSSVVEDLVDPMAQGIEIRNSDGRPDSVVEGNRVSGGQEGIVSHVSEVIVRDNDVAKTTMRGIAITEMSDGLVSGNRILSASGSGLFCGDMSRCAFDNNTATGVAVGAGGRSNAGWGLVVAYHSSASSHNDVLGGAAGETMTSMGSHIRERSPLDPASPARLVVPIALSALIAFALGGLAYAAAPLLRRRTPRDLLPRPVTGLFAVFLVVLGIQSFHMVEHWLQVYRVHVDLIPSRGGLVGPAVTSEWVHLAYNGGVMFFLTITFIELKKVAVDRRMRLLGAAMIVQGWHSLEHVAKVIQHVSSGAPVNPGIVGQFTDLVWLHFTVNLTVYGLCGAVAIAWIARWRHPVDALVSDPVPA